MQIGSHQFDTPLILAPMAGVTDRPFRELCRAHGADIAVSEMVTADTRLWASNKSRRRLDHRGEAAPRVVQIAGADPLRLADAARRCVDDGAEIIDINMGCPAKKVCNVMAGSALLQDEALVGRILASVVAAVPVPVTLKTRTGWDAAHKNVASVARIAEDAGIQALAIHGRTRACKYQGEADYQTIAAVKAAAGIPVFANGDIDSPARAREVLQLTAADGLLIGRGAQGNPFIFREIRHFLRTGELLAPAAANEVQTVLSTHLEKLYAFYGEYTGVRIARKHLAWYSKRYVGGAEFRRRVNRLETPAEQLAAVARFFAAHAEALAA